MAKAEAKDVVAVTALVMDQATVTVIAEAITATMVQAEAIIVTTTVMVDMVAAMAHMAVVMELHMDHHIVTVVGMHLMAQLLQYQLHLPLQLDLPDKAIQLDLQQGLCNCTGFFFAQERDTVLTV